MDFAGIDKLSLVDFDDKVSCVLFSYGCNFRCPFCHNSPLVNIPNDTFIPFSDILDYLKRRIGEIDAVVITGGEPTLMNDLEDKIIQIRKMGFLIKLDSNGSHPEVIKKLISKGLIDYIAMDIKNSFDKYELTVGCKADLKNIQESISIIMNSGIDYEFRTTLINEFHDKQSIIKIAQLLKGAKKYRLQKFVERDTCIKLGLHEVPIEKAQEFIEILEPYINNVSLRGY
jgi:pyruvate formate lyase activating enzyme